MKIVPREGEIIVSQSNADFGKLYTKSFPNDKAGAAEAFSWAKSIALGWRDIQDKEWEEYHAA